VKVRSLMASLIGIRCSTSRVTTWLMVHFLSSIFDAER